MPPGFDMLAVFLTWPQLFEAGMLACFGISWPISILKSWRTKYSRGKSAGFLLIVLIGYVSGTTAKFVKLALGGALEPVTALYVFNGILVAIDLTLYYRYRHNHEPLTKQVAEDIAEMIHEKEDADTHRRYF
jgi:hypothetical protein